MEAGLPADALAALAARVRDDLERIAHPRGKWLEPRGDALDVLVIGAGQSGLAIGAGLLRAKVDNILLVDRAPRGAEGPWLSYARMRTLRSPKDYTGPDLDLPSLTYQSWHEARYGAAHWQALDLIRREDWAAYLLWVRDTVGIPVQNEAQLTDLAPADGLIAATFADGTVRRARKVVLATGQDGMGEWWMPPFVAALPPDYRAHAADPIDFARLRGRRVAVLGIGASALDNAACALEAGAESVTVYCRRPEPQLVQPYRWLTFAGFLRHVGDLPDEWRWRFMRHIGALREGFPQPTWDRCARHANFAVVTGAAWTGATIEDGAVRIATAAGPAEADFVICGTGVEMDFTLRPELRRMAGAIARWSDRYTPPADEQDVRLARFPYLAPDYSLIPREPGFDWIGDVHVFSIAATMSFGPSGSSINAMTTHAPAVVRGLTRGLFLADVERHWASLRAYDVKQASIGPG
jgi:cation diffusion facilitator CzcD-associated flavoprotein CzcO